MTRPAGVDGRTDGARGSTSGGVRSEVRGCQAGISTGRRAEGPNRTGMERLVETGSSETKNVFSTSWAREVTPLDAFRSTVTMVARSALPGSESVSKSPRYIAV